jgi:hypothetical protein
VFDVQLAVMQTPDINAADMLWSADPKFKPVTVMDACPDAGALPTTMEGRGASKLMMPTEVAIAAETVTVRY